MKIRLLLPIVGLAMGFVVQTFAQHTNKIITVLPTGSDDTTNLQSAFDKAVAVGRGVTVRLVEGTYHTRQIVANNFNGAFIGAGKDLTVLTNLPGLVVKQPNIPFLDSPPTPSNPWPALVTFVNSDLLVSDMGISITGVSPFPEGYTVFSFLPTFQEMFQGVAIVGTTAKAIFLRVDVKGEIENGSEYNLINGIFFQGAGTGPVATAPPISGSFVVRDSTFRFLASPTPVLNVSHASILIGHNSYNSVLSAMEITGLADSRYEFLLNTVVLLNTKENSSFGVLVNDNDLAGTVVHVTSSEILVSNNAFNNASTNDQTGVLINQTGVFINATFEGGARCQVVANKFQNVNPGIVLGDGTSHCIVAGNSKTTIQNGGTDNVIVERR